MLLQKSGRLSPLSVAALIVSLALAGCESGSSLPTDTGVLCYSQVKQMPQTLNYTVRADGSVVENGLLPVEGIGYQTVNQFEFPEGRLGFDVSGAPRPSEADVLVTATGTFPVGPPPGTQLLNAAPAINGWSLAFGRVDAGFIMPAGLGVALAGEGIPALASWDFSVSFTDATHILWTVPLQTAGSSSTCSQLTFNGRYSGQSFTPAANTTYYAMVVRAPKAAATPQATQSFVIANGANNEAVLPAIAGISTASNISFAVTSGGANQTGTIAVSTQNWSGLPEIPGKTGVLYLTASYTGAGPVVLTPTSPPPGLLTANIVGTAFTPGTTYSVAATLAGATLGATQSIVAIPSTFGVPGGEIDFTTPLAGFSWSPGANVGIVIAH